MEEIQIKEKGVWGQSETLQVKSEKLTGTYPDADAEEWGCAQTREWRDSSGACGFCFWLCEPA